MSNKQKLPLFLIGLVTTNWQVERNLALVNLLAERGVNVKLALISDAALKKTTLSSSLINMLPVYSLIGYESHQHIRDSNDRNQIYLQIIAHNHEGIANFLQNLGPSNRILLIDSLFLYENSLEKYFSESFGELFNATGLIQHNRNKFTRSEIYESLRLSIRSLLLVRNYCDFILTLDKRGKFLAQVKNPNLHGRIFTVGDIRLLALLKTNKSTMKHTHTNKWIIYSPGYFRYHQKESLWPSFWTNFNEGLDTILRYESQPTIVLKLKPGELNNFEKFFRQKDDKKIHFSFTENEVCGDDSELRIVITPNGSTAGLEEIAKGSVVVTHKFGNSDVSEISSLYAKLGIQELSELFLENTLTNTSKIHSYTERAKAALKIELERDLEHGKLKKFFQKKLKWL